MTVTRQATTGNSAKFTVVTKHGEFTIALSFTLKTKIWQLTDEAAELAIAKELAEAIVSRHDPKLPFKKIYIFAEHNTGPDPVELVMHIRRHGIQ